MLPKHVMESELHVLFNKQKYGIISDDQGNYQVIGVYSWHICWQNNTHIF